MPTRSNVLGVIIPLLLTIGGLWSVRDVDARDSGALGLMQAMPILYFVFVGMVSVSFVLHVRRNAPGAVLSSHIVAMIVLLHGIASFIEQNPRFPTAYTHIGFVEYLLRHNAAAPELDARMSWPAFFAAGAVLTRVAGTEVFTFLLWAPLVMNFAYAPLVWSIARSATRDNRVAWLATGLFFSTSWVGQDYFAPQAVNFLIFLAFIAIMLRVFRSDDAPYPRLFSWPVAVTQWITKKVFRVSQLQPGGSPLLAMGPQERALAVAAMLIMYAACIVSHQLTPFFLLLNVGLLAVFRRTELRGFPLLLVISVFTWISYGAVGFWSGHLDQIFGGAGEVNEVVSQNVSERAAAVKDNHVYVIYLRLALSAGIWALAIFGVLRRLRAGRTDISMIMCMFAPFLILGGQSYGGEAILRVFFFSLPFAATLAVLALLPAENAMSRFKTLVACVVMVAMIPTFTIARWGNERFEQITKSEYEAAQELFRLAPLGSTLAQFDPNSPWQIRTRDLYDRRGNISADADPETIYQEVANRKDRDAFLFMTRGQIEAVAFEEGLPRSWGDDMTSRLVASGRFKILYENDDARIFQAVK